MKARYEAPDGGGYGAVIGSLFTGYGGLDMAVTDVFGGRVAWHCEIEPAPSRLLEHRYPGVVNLGDITTVDWSTVEPVDVLTGGSPCQDLSHAGKRKGMTEGTRSNLWVAMREAIAQLRPSLVVWENVRGAYSAEAASDLESDPRLLAGTRRRDGEPVLRALGRVLGDLSDLGYDCRWHGLRAADVGAPHSRFRVFVVATNTGRLRRGAWWPAVTGEARCGWAPADAAGRGLLPTPRATDGTKGGPNQRGSSGDLMLPSAVALLSTPAVNDSQRRILERVKVDPDSGCWMWTGWTNQAATPYGRVSIDGRKVYAHRASYEAFIGSIPAGYEVDHLCQTSLCVNPTHLEAVSPEENRDRVAKRRTHCKHGHEFTEENTYWVRPGARACRACRAWQDKVQKARRRGEEIPLLPTPVTNDMGEGKTVEAWDEWTAKMQAAHANGNGHGKSLAIEAQRLLPAPTSADSKASGAAGYNGNAFCTLTDATVRRSQDWGDYADAIARWERLTRPAPPPTQPSKKGTPQLSPAFVEWMMGLPAGWVTDVPGITRNQALKMLGNGVVPQQAALALRLMLQNGLEVAS